MRLHLGCGRNIMTGWENLDLEPEQGAHHWDAHVGLTNFAAGTVDFIYCEHFIEHVSYFAAQKIFYEASRVLKKGGVFRLSTPDLETIIRDAMTGEWQGKFEQVGWRPGTRAQFINEAFRSWGHTFIYDYRELLTMGTLGGFDPENIYPVERSNSFFAELSNLETRPNYGDLIIEFKK